MTKCEHYIALNLGDLCKILTQHSPLWNDLVSHMHPKLVCPFKSAFMEVTNATIDLAYVGYRAIAGYTFISTVNFFQSIARIWHRKRMLFCMIFETPVMRKHQSAAKKNQ